MFLIRFIGAIISLIMGLVLMAVLLAMVAGVPLAVIYLVSFIGKTTLIGDTTMTWVWGAVLIGMYLLCLEFLLFLGWFAYGDAAHAARRALRT